MTEHADVWMVALTYSGCLIVGLAFVWRYRLVHHSWPESGGVLAAVFESAATVGLLKVSLKLLAGGFATVLTSDEQLCLFVGSVTSIYVLLMRIRNLFNH